MNSDKLKIALISDLHYSKNANQRIPSRRGEIADQLLEKTIKRLNRYIKPDITLLLGDLLDSPDSSDAIQLMLKLKTILDTLKTPYIAIPGNHDPQPERFYTVFPRQKLATDIKGVRILSFIDAEAPGYNATRSEKDLKRMEKAATDFKGSVITIQHVPIFPPERKKCAYNYTNIEKIIQVLDNTGIRLNISGHFHAGFKRFNHRKSAFLCVPAFCESPHQFSILEIYSKNMLSVSYKSLDS